MTRGTTRDAKRQNGNTKLPTRGIKDDGSNERRALAGTGGDRSDRGLCPWIPQLFRLLRRLQVLRPTAIALRPLRRMRVPFVRGDPVRQHHRRNRRE